ncbi:MAG: UDP-N-acetylmuramoyl-L-alanine--D-glutamate ligase [Desulfobulbaceae bacterium]|nr:UDP-N-acetylmuramoyl-L-alanine--D-glutamate ligase [Desulfobulbaceae bacterium]
MQLKQGMQAVVIGLGTAGLSTVKFLLRQGLRVAVSERGTIDQIDPYVLKFLQHSAIRIETGGHSAAFLVGADVVIPGPGVPLSLPIIRAAREQGLPIMGELALAAGRYSVPVIAVTGSNGKTTVTSLIGTLLQMGGKTPFVGGNIGRPLLDYFADPGPYATVVLELSSFQLDLAGAFRPDVGLLLNISPDHLDRHGSLSAYTAAKMNLFGAQVVGDVAILGGDDPVADAAPLNGGVLGFWFGKEERCAARIIDGQVRVRLERSGVACEEMYDLAGTRLHSSVNQLNAAAAILAATLCNCSREAIIAGLAAFEPPPHRMAEVGEIDGVRFINDSKATNIGALQAALGGCTSPVILIAGGRDKGGDYTMLQEVVRAKVKHLVLVGEAADLMEAALGTVVGTESATTMADAVRKAKAAAVSGDLVLLAPGCASYDMFSGYEERGRVFAECVHQLRREPTGKEGEP